MKILELIGSNNVKKVNHKNRSYYVLNNGTVFSEHKSTRKLIQRRGTLNSVSGYVHLDKTYIHRIVALAYCPNPNKKPCVNHKDGDKTNNAPNNLEWVTHSENHLHAYKKLGRKTPVGRYLGGGVSFDKSRNNFRAYIGSRKWIVRLGRFKTKKEAENAVMQFRNKNK